MPWEAAAALAEGREAGEGRGLPGGGTVPSEEGLASGVGRQLRRS